MRCWGYGPFQNDTVLTELGGYSTSNKLEEKLKTVMKKNTPSICGAFEVTALLIDTFGEPDFIISSDKKNRLISAIKQSNTSGEIKELLDDYSKAWLSACTFDRNKRYQLLNYSIDILCKIAKSGNINSAYVPAVKRVIDVCKEKYLNSSVEDVFIEESVLSQFIRTVNNNTKFSYSDEVDSNLLNKYEDNSIEVSCLVYPIGSNEHLVEYHIIGSYERERCTFKQMKKLIDANKIYKIDPMIKREIYLKLGESNALKVVCIDKIYKGKQIIGYIIEDEHGRRNQVTSAQLKDSIKSKTVNCINLKLTSDGKLINK